VRQGKAPTVENTVYQYLSVLQVTVR